MSNKISERAHFWSEVSKYEDDQDSDNSSYLDKAYDVAYGSSISGRIICRSQTARGWYVLIY